MKLYNLSHLQWSIIWVILAFLFTLVVWLIKGSDCAILFLSGYLLEKSLSLDNMMVFALIFQNIKIPSHLQPKLLQIGVISAIVLRGILIFLGTNLIKQFTWVLAVMGIFLILTGIKTLWLTKKTSQEIPLQRWGEKIFKLLPISKQLAEEKFMVIEEGKRKFTPLLVAIILIEFSDIIFAVDSIPAIFAITTDPFLVYTSNIFAILGLRSLYFVVVSKLDYLQKGLGAILIFIGVKMAFDLKISSILSLLIIASILGTVFVIQFYKRAR